MIGNDAVIGHGVTANWIAPAVVYVASEQSEWLTRRVISSGNGKIGLHSDFDMQIELETDNSDGVWDNESAFAAIERNFKDAPEQLNFWGPK